MTLRIEPFQITTGSSLFSPNIDTGRCCRPKILLYRGFITSLYRQVFIQCFLWAEQSASDRDIKMNSLSRFSSDYPKLTTTIFSG